MQAVPLNFSVPFVPYPTPPFRASLDACCYQLDLDPFSMGARATNHVQVDGLGVLDYQSAIDIARNSEGELDPTVSAYLELALTDIWSRISLNPTSYIMTKDEFAVFNFYRARFEGDQVAEQAVARYWSHTHDLTTDTSA
ncbi:unnamed protein product [Zymoseptoria tritici ST99CH_1A5]|nr:unnamed protein product [Zymoseptoria tritici ST99CH_1E4]SMR63875.1 unnamed protein product [Zymoseptoria tritici ST99CH_3D1]SMY29227.1 unnamed protein product [Zymoseptoria tritici ST99CH_1A5]